MFCCICALVVESSTRSDSVADAHQVSKRSNLMVKPPAGAKK